ncbi:MAG: S41 family peptidase [Tannerellaceae bacterium]|jgi:carboxyl-terminal processing protease|nr:S41 family peptidase [Tannerellaceae bacterium]
MALLITTSGSAQTDNRFEVSRQLDIFNALVKELELFYVDTVNMEQTVRRGIDAMLEGLDPYTEYIPEQEIDALRMLTTGEYAGVGAYIMRRPEGVIITELFENMPAATGGLRAGDVFLQIDNTDVRNESSERVSEMLKGVPNSKLKVQVQRPGAKKPLTVELTRKQVVVNQVVYYGLRSNNVGYIYLRGFTDRSAAEVKAALEDLKRNHNISALILDLRNNGGGILESATQIVNMFVPKGREVVSTKGKTPQWDRIYRTSIEPIDTVMPLAVIINGQSASSAEIVAGALQDLDRAVLVGQRSFGKGLVQAPRELPYNGNLKVTMSKYYIPSGRCIQQIDYSHRNPDGSARHIPDSLTTLFHTVNGRPVRDGGGITPDFTVDEPRPSALIYYLMQEPDILFDFVTNYVLKHPTIAPAETFAVTDADLADLKAYAAEKNFSYNRQSSKMLASLKEMARFEGYLADADTAAIQELEAHLTPNLDKDFARFGTEIKQLLSAEIVKRYYYERGELIQNLQNDPVLAKAVEVLSAPQLVAATLRPQ